jgi:sulfur carrier protein ThiS
LRRNENEQPLDFAENLQVKDLLAKLGVNNEGKGKQEDFDTYAQ